MADAELEVSEEQRSHAVYRHPLSSEIHAYLRRGRTPEWVSYWLEEQYPLEDEDGEDLPASERRQNQKRRITKRTIDRYRTRFMPECSPGVDLIRADIEDIVGRRPPLPPGEAREIQRLEGLSAVGEHILAMSLKADADLEMVQQTTLESLKAVFDMNRQTIDIKSKLGLPGYEAAPIETKQSIDQRVEQTTHAVNIELHGKHAPAENGQGGGPPNEPSKVSALRDVMSKPPEAVRALLAAAKEQSVDGSAEEEPDA